jgi:hypothetical protein
MFRESDYSEPQLHATYARKPRSILQTEAQLAQFDGHTSSQVHNGRQELPPNIPITYDTVVDPTHPDADWTVDNLLHLVSPLTPPVSLPLRAS